MNIKIYILFYAVLLLFGLGTTTIPVFVVATNINLHQRNTNTNANTNTYTNAKTNASTSIMKERDACDIVLTEINDNVIVNDEIASQTTTTTSTSSSSIASIAAATTTTTNTKHLTIEYVYEMEYKESDNPYMITNKVKQSVGKAVIVSTFSNCESKHDNGVIGIHFGSNDIIKGAYDMNACMNAIN